MNNIKFYEIVSTYNLFRSLRMSLLFLFCVNAVNGVKETHIVNNMCVLSIQLASLAGMFMKMFLLTW